MLMAVPDAAPAAIRATRNTLLTALASPIDAGLRRTVACQAFSRHDFASDEAYGQGLALLAQREGTPQPNTASHDTLATRLFYFSKWVPGAPKLPACYLS